MSPPNDNRRLYLIIGILVSILLIITAITVATERSSYYGRASAPGGRSVGPAGISRENSYVFASPVSATADGNSMIRVTVFLLDSQGMGVSGQNVQLNINPPANISQVSPVTDSFGRATFDVSATNPGDYKISAQAQDAVLPQTVSVSFR